MQRAQAWDAAQAEKALAKVEDAKQNQIRDTQIAFANLARDFRDVTDRGEPLEGKREQLRRLVAVNGKGGTTHAVVQAYKAVVGEKHNVQTSGAVVEIKWDQAFEK